ncbi:accessory Sec system S-layer assembly protein [Bacillus luteolus]|uniref:Accessory Sec system S-layer assembly protein n=1 Tax=Litchfieldia luteola TaxID=682179 RepID=A0ABR9QF09_9BACI|nr:accessory Sec system S-layer assembly protein [Cytobacillus luteolus]MBE4907089.1 accessory Sec system S-layer assembly protein [Cytobacillus luteolus]
MGHFNDTQKELDENNEHNTSQEETTQVKTTLSFHPEWDLPASEKYVYQFKHQKLEPLQPNQISVSGINLIEYDEGFVVTAFLRNTLPKGIEFETIDLLVIDNEGNALARKTFEMDLLGEIPSMGCRPWRFLFQNENKLIDGPLPQDGDWNLAFELKQSAPMKLTLDLEESWKNSLAEDKVQQLREMVEKLPALKPGEVNFMGIQATKNESGELLTTILIRNASNQNINLEQVPLVIEDATNSVVAKGLFKLENFEVKANTCKPWTFIFPASLQTEDEMDLSRWKAYVPQQ